MYREYWGLKKPPFDNIPDPRGPANHNDPLTSHGALKNYIRERLRFAGAPCEIFTEDACNALLRHSQGGLSWMVNRLAKLCLIAGEIEGLREVNEETVDRLASRLTMANAPALPERKPRRRAGKG